MSPSTDMRKTLARQTKLQLNRQTVRILSEVTLRTAEGGAFPTVFGRTCLDPGSRYQCTTATCPLSYGSDCFACR